MSMNTHVVGFRPADERWNKMKAAWLACDELGIDPPREVLEFFDHEPPDDKPGQEVNIERTGAVKKYESDSGSGYEVDITKLPPGVTIVRFYNSW